MKMMKFSISNTNKKQNTLYFQMQNLVSGLVFLHPKKKEDKQHSLPDTTKIHKPIDRRLNNFYYYNYDGLHTTGGSSNNIIIL